MLTAKLIWKENHTSQLKTGHDLNLHPYVKLFEGQTIKYHKTFQNRKEIKKIKDYYRKNEKHVELINFPTGIYLEKEKKYDEKKGVLELKILENDVVLKAIVALDTDLYIINAQGNTVDKVPRYSDVFQFNSGNEGYVINKDTMKTRCPVCFKIGIRTKKEHDTIIECQNCCTNYIPKDNQIIIIDPPKSNQGGYDILCPKCKKSFASSNLSNNGVDCSSCQTNLRIMFPENNVKRN